MRWRILCDRALLVRDMFRRFLPAERPCRGTLLQLRTRSCGSIGFIRLSVCPDLRFARRRGNLHGSGIRRLRQPLIEFHLPRWNSGHSSPVTGFVPFCRRTGSPPTPSRRAVIPLWLRGELP